ncbi:MAG: glycosyltransferase [Acidobacteriota bacterium]|nr:glycosyltransferase [Acidobacteriota bacterium]
MISVVCVYNDEDVLAARLLQSLQAQTAAHEVIAVDNRAGRFESGASALNHGARQAKGEWLAFVHQDVSLISSDWLAKAEQMLEEIQPMGWTGSAGVTKDGEFRGWLLDRARLLGAPFDGFVEVQTLDECLLICRRGPDGEPYFDEGLSSWHAYGVEACCRAIAEGRRNYVIPLPVWHDSRSTNMAGLAEAHAYVWRKHGSRLGRIATTCGVLPDTYAGGPNRASVFLKRAEMWAWKKLHRLGGFRTEYIEQLDEGLELLTKDAPVVESLHRPAPHGIIEARAFLPQPASSRRVLHRFRDFAALTQKDFQTDCVVVMPELAVELLSNEEAARPLFERARRLLICLNVGDLLAQPRLWRRLQRRAANRYIVRKCDYSKNTDGRARSIAIFEICREGTNDQNL